jgi:glycogen synthase
MGLNLETWSKNWQLMEAFFDELEIAEIALKLKHLKMHHIVYCSFENRFAKSGGLAAVTSRILPHFSRLTGIRSVSLITPFYPYIIDETQLKHTGKSVIASFGGRTVKIEILNYSHNESGLRKPVEEYYLKAEGFFEADNRLNDPYIYYRDDADRNNETIKENALLFSKAVPLVAAELGISKDVIFHLQEWQTALVSLTAKTAMLEGTMVSCGTVQTMHNPFDCFIPLEDLEKILEAERFQQFLVRGAGGHTAYQLGLQLVDAPLTTVSKHFAAEFISDIFQTHHFTPHLQDIFQHNGIFGINNGMFTDLLPELSAAVSSQTALETIKQVKLKKRKALLKVLGHYEPEGHFGYLTYRKQPITRLPEKIPVLLMSGRLDPVQKGFDIFLRALEKFGRDEIKVVLTPLPLQEADLAYFYKIAFRCRGDVVVYPIRMTQGYHELQTGSTFGIMPSIYEPFGAAVEYMANGTVTIARAAGGLKNQIEDGVCGFLFREDGRSYNLENIDAFTRSANRIEERRGNPWVENMAEQLYRTIKKASDLYRYQPDDYHRMILKGLQKATSFTWTENAKNYLEVFKRIRSGFEGLIG